MFLCDESPYKISDEKGCLIIWKNSNQKPKTISQKNHLIKAQAFFLSPKSVKKVWSGSGNASKDDMETACPEYLIKVIESSPFKTINKGRRDLIDSFAIYKSWVDLYGNLLSKN